VPKVLEGITFKDGIEIRKAKNNQIISGGQTERHAA